LDEFPEFGLAKVTDFTPFRNGCLFERGRKIVVRQNRNRGAKGWACEQHFFPDGIKLRECHAGIAAVQDCDPFSLAVVSGTRLKQRWAACHDREHEEGDRRRSEPEDPKHGEA